MAPSRRARSADPERDGGDGIDRRHVNFSYVASGVTYTLNDGPRQHLYGVKTLTGFEGSGMYGSSYGDTLTCGSGTDALDGPDGDYVLSGEAGHDYRYGGEGADMLSGGEDMTLLLTGQVNLTGGDFIL